MIKGYEKLAFGSVSDAVKLLFFQDSDPGLLDELDPVSYTHLLGLYIVRTIIKLHGGEITVSSVENEYTQFQFYLPKKMCIRDSFTFLRQEICHN